MQTVVVKSETDEAPGRCDTGEVGPCVAVNFVVGRDGSVGIVRRLPFRSGAEALAVCQKWEQIASRWRRTLLAGSLYFDDRTAVSELPTDADLRATVAAWLLLALEGR